MDIRQISPNYAVSPQIRPEDVAAAKEAGYTTIISNRPDTEVEGDERAEAIRAACEAEGVRFVENPVQNGAMTADNVTAQARARAESGGPALAYCRSGTRSATVWALGEATSRPAEEIIAEAGRAGYDLSPLRPQLDTMRS